MTHCHHGVPPIEAGGGEVIVEIVCLEARQTIELVLQPLPYIAIHVIEPHRVGWEHVHRLQVDRHVEHLCYLAILYYHYEFSYSHCNVYWRIYNI